MVTNRIPCLHLVCAALLTLVAASGCATGLPQAVSEARALQVAYYDFGAGRPSFLLVSETDPSYAGVAATPRNPSAISIKRAPDETLRDLVAFAADRDFFAYAQPIQDPTEARNQNAKALIVIQADGAPYGMTLLLPMEKERIQTFADMSFEIARVFAEVPAVQLLDVGTGGSNYFEEQQRRVNESNAQRSGSRQ